MEMKNQNYVKFQDFNGKFKKEIVLTIIYGIQGKEVPNRRDDDLRLGKNRFSKTDYRYTNQICVTVLRALKVSTGSLMWYFNRGGSKESYNHTRTF